MSDRMVEQVRRFNRVVTERVGALDDRFLGRTLPLGEARLLWEVGPDGCEVRLLRSRLALDSGYLSRMLHSLETAGLIEVRENPADRRIRIARLTTAGRRERAMIDRRSDKRAASLLEPLSVEQRERLVDAMRDVERLLTAASVDIRHIDPEHPDAKYCVAEYVAELNRRARERRTSRVFDPAVGATAHPHELRHPGGAFFVAYLHGSAVGCGGVKHHRDAPAEIKRMWIAPDARGLALGRRMLDTLESCAIEGGARVAQIETSAVSAEALSLYRSSGWVEVQRFNDEPFADHWFEKRLTCSSLRSAARPRCRNHA